MPRSIEDVLRIKQRQLEEIQREINTLQAAVSIMESEPELSALERAAEAVIPNSGAAKPGEKRWP